MTVVHRKMTQPPATATALALLWVLATASALSSEDSSPASSPSIVPACFDTSVALMPCLTFIENVSRTARPEGRCCPAVAVASVTDSACLCKLLSSPDILGIELNFSKALKLPLACNIQLPAVSPCTDLGLVAPVTASSGSSIFRVNEMHSATATLCIVLITIKSLFG